MKTSGGCLVCEQGYFINSYFQCVKYSPNLNTPSCDVDNCLYCVSNNYCGACLFGWEEVNGTCQTENFCEENCEICTNSDTCIKCKDPNSYTLTSGFCVPKCTI